MKTVIFVCWTCTIAKRGEKGPYGPYGPYAPSVTYESLTDAFQHLIHEADHNVEALVPEDGGLW